jgi:hypothetical protein
MVASVKKQSRILCPEYGWVRFGCALKNDPNVLIDGCRFPSPVLPGSGSKGFSQRIRTPSVGRY